MIARIATFFMPFQYLLGVEKGVIHIYSQSERRGHKKFLEGCAPKPPPIARLPNSTLLQSRVAVTSTLSAKFQFTFLLAMGSVRRGSTQELLPVAPRQIEFETTVLEEKLFLISPLKFMQRMRT